MGNRLEFFKMPFVARTPAAEPSMSGGTVGWRKRLGQAFAGRKLPALAALLVVVILIDAAIVVYDAREATFNTLYVAAVGKIRMLSQRLAKAAQQASQGNREAFKQLRDSRDEFAAVVQLLESGGTASGVSLPATPQHVRPQLSVL